MSKKKPTPDFIENFFKAVYPEYTEACLCFSSDEKTILGDATKIIIDLRSEKAALYEALKAVEWQDLYCPYCESKKEFGHTADCKIGVALRKAEGK